MHSLSRRCAAAAARAHRRAAAGARHRLGAESEGHLQRTYEFADFAAALAFANRVGAIAEEQGHHPDLYVAWGKCGVEIWTHKIDGLTESDFFLAAKVDRAFSA